MRPERLLPIILMIAGVAAFVSVYHKKTQSIAVPPEFADQPGPRLFFEHDCVTCHTVSALPGARGTLGPGLDNIGERASELSPSGDAKSYLRESLLDPSKVVRPGFVNAMPSFSGKLSPGEIEQMVDWLSTLKTVSTSKGGSDG